MDKIGCIKCGEDKDANDLSKDSSTKKGYRNICKKCIAEIRKIDRVKNKDKIRESRKKYKEVHKEELKIRNKEYYYRTKDMQLQKRKNNRRKLWALLKSGPCTDCKGVFHPVCMDFDHLDSSKKVCQISQRLHNASIDCFKEELSKCELVCSNCHRLRTFKRKNKDANS